MAIVAYYRFNGNSNDASGTGNNGSDTNVTYGQGYGITNGGANFKRSTASKISFNCTNFPTGANPLTISLWVKLDSQPTTVPNYDWYYIFNYGVRDYYKLNMLGYNNNSGTYRVFYAGWGADISVNYTLTNGTWYHLIARYSGTQASIFINSILKVVPTTVTRNSVASDGYMSNDGVSSNANINGSLDEVKVLNTSWSSAHIKNEYSRVKGILL